VSGLAGRLDVEDERVSDLLPALAAWHRREREETAVEDWRYRAAWVPVGEPAAAAPSGDWLALVPAGREDDDTVALALAALRERGARVTVLQTGPADLDRAAFAGRLAATVADLGDTTPAGVLSLLAVDADLLPGSAGVPVAVAASLVLVQALGDAGIEAPLWALTRGAVSTGAHDPLASIRQAQIWGLGRVVALEHPERWGGLVDLPTAWDERAAARLCAALTGTGGEDQLALRQGGLLARRLVRAPRPAEAEPWTPRGSVLITGGTGGIGGHVARWLAGRGAPRLVLTSRSGAGAAGVAAQAAQLAASGSRVDVVACDMAERAQVEGLFARVAAEGPALAGVIHSAGVGEATAIEQFTLAQLARVSAVKTAGADLLDELTAGLDLDVFVLFSSVSATWGSGLQPGYAAANAHLDALAEDRRTRCLPATSVAWGLWDGGGMGSGESAEQLQRYGLRLMDPALGIRGLAQAVDGRETAVSVADVDWERFAPTFTMRRSSPLLETIEEARRALTAEAAPAAATAGTGAGEDLAARLAALPAADRDRMLTDLVRAEAASVLGYPSADAVEPDRAFKDLGVDSVTAVELRNKLNAATGLRLSSTLVFDYPNPAVLAVHLRELLAPADAGPASILDELGRLEERLAALDAKSEAQGDDVTRRLRAILSRWIDARDGAAGRQDEPVELEAATATELFDFLDNELGLS